MTAAPDNTGGFDALEALLAESLQVAAQKESTAAAKARLARDSGSAAERAEDAARVAAWEAAREWSLVANVAMFTRTVCECGSAHEAFAGLFARETHRTLGMSQRWRRADEADAAMPNEVAMREASAPMCADCAERKGWLVGAAYVWKE